MAHSPSSLVDELRAAAIVVLGRATEASADEPVSRELVELNPSLRTNFEVLHQFGGAPLPSRIITVWSSAPPARYRAGEPSLLWLSPLPWLAEAPSPWRQQGRSGSRGSVDSLEAAESAGLALGQGLRAFQDTSSSSGRTDGDSIGEVDGILDVLCALAQSAPEPIALRAIFELGALSHHREAFSPSTRSILLHSGPMAGPDAARQSALRILLHHLGASAQATRAPVPGPPARANGSH